MPENYEILPHEELEYLRREVERLKRNPLGDTHASADLLDSMRELNANVKRLVEIFQSANDEMTRAFHENSVQEQLRKLREENAKIAKGIVALSKMIHEAPEQQVRAPPVQMGPPQDELPVQEEPSQFEGFTDRQNPFADDDMPPLPQR